MVIAELPDGSPYLFDLYNFNAIAQGGETVCR
jgi:hypothetical protein